MMGLKTRRDGEVVVDLRAGRHPCREERDVRGDEGVR